MTDFVEGDTGSVLRVTCLKKSDGTAINLTGATVRLKWIGSDGSTLTTQVMTIESPASAGIVTYQFAADELFPHLMKFEVEITDAGGYVLSNLELIKQIVRPQLS